MNRQVKTQSGAIRKKALEYAKKRQWDLALKEYVRLAEIEEHNPNVFNELGDLHLKMGNKKEAFKSFHSAIDAYTSVSLFNNAVAVCKKIIRLNSNDHNVYGKLARLRNQQGFKKEAATYSMMYLDRLADDSVINPEELKTQLTELASEMNHAPEVMERAAEYLNKWEFLAEAVIVLEALAEAYTAMGKTAESEEIRKKLAGMGIDASPAAEDGGFESDQVQLDPSGATIPGMGSGGGDNPLPPPGGPPGDAFDFDVEIPSADSSAVATGLDDAPVMPPPLPGEEDEIVLPDVGSDSSPLPGELPPDPSATDFGADLPGELPPDPVAPDSGSDLPAELPPDPVAPDSGSDLPVGKDEVWIPQEEIPDSLDAAGGDAVDGGEVMGVNEIVGAFNAEVKADIDSEDHRSHYDLGMAYLEMDLLPEAIREFQFAANAEEFRVRSLEMVGVCFIKQGQPRLAIKQLEKGLTLVGEGDREALGLQYNLGLAFEMIGEVDRAKASFEEVYVVDVTFREVGEKMKRYSS